MHGWICSLAYVMLHGMECDVTWNGMTRHPYVRHHTISHGVDHVLSAYQVASELLRSGGVPIVSIPTHTGLDLSDYNSPHRDTMDRHQYRK